MYIWGGDNGNGSPTNGPGNGGNGSNTQSPGGGITQTATQAPTTQASATEAPATQNPTTQAPCPSGKIYISALNLTLVNAPSLNNATGTSGFCINLDELVSNLLGTLTDLRNNSGDNWIG